MLPSPIAEPAAARTNPNFEPHFSRVCSISAIKNYNFRGNEKFDVEYEKNEAFLQIVFL